MSRRWGVQIAVALLAVLAGTLAGADPASAACQLQWQPDLSGETGGSLVLVCDDPSAPTGNAGTTDDGGGGKHQKPETSFAAIAVNMTTLEDGDGDFSGATSAGHRTRANANRAAVRACRRGPAGRCKSVVSARDGWAALVVTADKAQRLRVFGGSGRTYDAAFGAATRRARAAMGEAIGGPIERVQAVRSRPQ